MDLPPHAAEGRLPIGEMLVAAGKLSARDLEQALAAQLEMQDLLGRILVRLGLLGELDLAQVLARQLQVPLAQAEEFPEDLLAVRGLSPDYLRQHRLLPLTIDETRLCVAMATPQDGFLLKAMRLASGLEVTPALALESEIEVALQRYFEVTDQEEGDEPRHDAGDSEFVEHLRDLATEAPVIRLVNQIIGRVVDMRASDIHLEPFEDVLQVRYRIDGVLQNEPPVPIDMAAAVTSRIKLMAHLNIAERRLPQDGRIKTRVKGREIDLRISTLPTVHGESVVIRVLDRASVRIELEKMGFASDILSQYRELLARPHGILLVTGPTGSGKTTTLYASLTKLDSATLKIVTVEDPVEYQLGGINQVQVQSQIGLDFAHSLRSILRQDPDVIMIGEMRDGETAQIAVQSALTGHLVLSTLHTNTAAGAVVRLVDMGIERYLITSTLNGVLSQRLVRRLCEACREPVELADSAIEAAGLARFMSRGSGRIIYRAAGCPVCKRTGYLGRTSIHELLLVDDPMVRAILDGSDANALHSLARSRGMRTLNEDGLRKVAEGVTSLEEVARVTQDQQDE
ncbi:MAG: type II secretion system ATPase GspE [Rhodocyclaceae bacterium]|nr:type II secretion system ATPase GspE [Rhodocyclaceae bacterium]